MCSKSLSVVSVLSLFLAAGGAGGTGPAETPVDAQVQGLYEGAVRDAAGESKIEGRVVAQGNGNYKLLIRRFREDDRMTRVELVGETSGGIVAVAGAEGQTPWKGVFAEDAFRGECGPGATFEMRRVEKKSPTLGKRPPPGAVVLLDGKDFSEMVRTNGAKWHLGAMSQDGWTVWETPLYTVSEKEPAVWPTQEKPLPQNWLLSKEHRRADTVIGIGEDGSTRIPRGGMNSRLAFDGSFDLHVEFLCDFAPRVHSQGRSNSGVRLPCGDEIQVLDSFGEATYFAGGCGALYGHKEPDTMDVIESLQDKPQCKFTLASLPPLTWQTYDVEYRVEQKDGKYVGKPHVTIHHNGIKIHDNVAVRGEARKGPFRFQDHGCPVRYRNIWILPVEPK